jgi:hypothetical protein
MFAGVRSPELLVTVSPLGQAQATLRLPNAE